MTRQAGWKHTEEAKLKISQSKIGSKNPNWKEKITYKSLHTWINRHKLKSEKCETCGKKGKLDAANISQEYKRDINDYKWLCRKCHMESDGRFKNLKQYG